MDDARHMALINEYKMSQNSERSKAGDHANTSTTMNIYAHSLQSADKQAADMMENIIAGKKKKDTDKKQA
jgi:hypothetical protein